MFNSNEYSKKYWQLNKESLKESKKEYYKINKKHLLKKAKAHYVANKEEKLKYSKKYRLINKEGIAIYQKEYYKENKQYLTEYKINWKKQKLKKDPIYRLIDNLRNGFRDWLVNNPKNKRTFEYINCTKQELVEHIESKFYDNPETGEKMTWDNYGKFGWHVDHIRPLSSFDCTKEKDRYAAWSKDNLQPLWAKDNLRKGNKITI